MLQSALRGATSPTALVDFLFYWYRGKPGESPRWGLAAFVVSGEDITRIELGPVEAILQQLTAWRNTLGRPHGTDDPGGELRRLLWEPLAKHLEGIDTVLISPDGVLAQLPWGALPGEKPGTYLIDDRSLSVIPVPQLLPELLERESSSGPPQSLLLTGDIEYGGDAGTPQDLLVQRSAVGISRDGKLLAFPKLEAAQAELASVERRYRKKAPDIEPRTLEGSEATESAFREQAGRYAWLHVITHGFFAPEALQVAVKAVADDKWNANERKVITGVHPGLLSGLAFAGANAPPEGGKTMGS